PPRVATDPAAVDVGAELLSLARAIAADAPRVEADAPLVEELAERVRARPVGLDVDEAARTVGVKRRVGDRRGVDVAGDAVSLQLRAGRAAASDRRDRSGSARTPAAPTGRASPAASSTASPVRLVRTGRRRVHAS